MTQAAYLPKVKAQYERFPYPPRIPEDEYRFLHASITECLDALNEYNFAGKRNFHKNFRVLCAGGGTGDSVVFLAEQLRGTEAEIVYLDMSQASMDVAKARTDIRGVTDNITWVKASLLDVANQGLGEFDYINCSGVLHHLENPQEGLKALCDVLAPDGVMGIMVYGKYGRTAIYQMQELISHIASDDDDDDKLAVCKTILSNLPPTNWFQHSKDLFNDWKNGDAALYDLLLHSQDRAYSIPELYDFIESAGLNITTFVGKNECDPIHHVRDEALYNRIKSMETKEQFAIGELLGGTAKAHTFYASRKAMPRPSADDLEMVPCLPVNTHPDIYGQLYQLVKDKPGAVRLKTAEARIYIPDHPAIPAVLKFINGKNSLKDIYASASAQTNTPRAKLKEAFTVLYDSLSKVHMMFLRHKDVPAYITSHEIQTRLNQNKIS